jgi:RNA polymerase sigma-70 factor (ECF subfamily)
MHQTPASLLERLRQPDERAAWDHFVELYTPLLYHWAGQLGLQGHDAADLVQDVFTLLVQHLPAFTYDPKRRFRNWLWTILLNRWRETRRRPPAVTLGNDAGLDETAAVADPLEVHVEGEYRRYLVGRALEIMKAEFQPTTWQACWEHVVSGRSAADVAVQLGISEGAVYVAKHRVLRRLRQELEGFLD